MPKAIKECIDYQFNIRWLLFIYSYKKLFISNKSTKYLLVLIAILLNCQIVVRLTQIVIPAIKQPAFAAGRFNSLTI